MIPLRKSRGSVFIRTGRSLLLSDIHPDAPPTGYEYSSETILIAVANNVARHQLLGSFHVPVLVDFPPHYRYNVEYIHPWYKVEKDPYTVGSRSLRIKFRRLEEMIQSRAESPGADGFVEHCSAYWALWCDILTNITRGRLPFSNVRPRPDSIILCVKLIRESYVKLTRENYALHRDETPSFIAFLADMLVRSVAGYRPFGKCRLAPLPQHSSHMQSAHPSSMYHGLMGYRSITVANETFTVRDLHIPDNLNKLRPAVLF